MVNNLKNYLILVDINFYENMIGPGQDNALPAERSVELEQLRNEALANAILSTYSTQKNRRNNIRMPSNLSESRMNWNCYLCHK